MSEPGDPAVRLENVTRTFMLGGQPVHALRDVSLTIARGQFVAVVGPSGSGKSTLLHVLAGLDRPTSGRIWIAGEEVIARSDDALTRMRRARVGVVHQFFNLLPTLSVRENVALPLLLGGADEREVLDRADALIAEVGLAPRREARPHTLSGGEMQRTAIARALLPEPPLVLADEPTGNLDSKTAAQVIQLLRDLASKRGTTVMLVTHSIEAASAAERTITLRDGALVDDRRRA